MRVITIESEAFKRMQMLLERAARINVEKDEILSLEQAAEYIGVDKQWVYSRRKKIGYIQEGKIIRIRKSNVDKYLESISIEPTGVNKYNTKTK